MHTYAFTVLTNITANPDIVDKVYGLCDDVTATCENGQLAISFDRDSESLDHAIRQALEQLRSLQILATAVTIESESLTLLQN